MNKAATAAIGYRFRTASSSAISPLTRQLRAMQRRTDRQTERGRYDGPTGAEGGREEGRALLFSQFWHCRRHNRFYRVIAAVTVCLSGTATFSIADRCFDVCPVTAEGSSNRSKCCGIIGDFMLRLPLIGLSLASTSRLNSLTPEGRGARGQAPELGTGKKYLRRKYLDQGRAGGGEGMPSR